MANYTPEELETMRNSLQEAKNNPDDPRSQEIFKRINEGKMNYELKALGLPTVKVERPKINPEEIQRISAPQGEQTVMPEADKQMGVMGIDADFTPSGIRERFGDIKETGQAIGRQFGEAGRDIVDTFKRDDRNLAEKAVMIGGRAFGGGAGAFGELITGAGKFALTQDAEDKVADLFQKAASGVAETELAQNTINWYNELDPRDRDMVDAAGGFAAVLGELVGLRGSSLVGKGVREVGENVVEQAPRVGRAVQEGVENTARRTGEALDAASASRRAERLAEQETKVENAVGRITQAGSDTRAREQASRALADIDRTGVETYADLNQRFADRVEVLAQKVDQELNKYPDTIPSDQWVSRTRVGDEVVFESPVIDALDGLENAYTKSGELVDAARIRQLRNKVETEGLTLKEANDLARDYGIEFRDRAFNTMGDAKTGYNAENFENVRTSLKQAVRDKMPDETTRELDRKMSDIYATRRLTEKIEDKVQKLSDRIKERTLSQKVWGGVTDALDAATLGGVRGFFLRALPSNVGNKSMNALDIQDDLRRQLDEIDELMEIQNEKSFAEALTKYVQDVPVGMSIRSTVTPLSVGRQLTEKEFDMFVEAIPDVATARLDPEFNALLKKYGLDKAEDAELERFMKEATDQFELPEDAPEAQSFNQPATAQTTNLVEEAKKYDSATDFTDAIAEQRGGIKLMERAELRKVWEGANPDKVKAKEARLSEMAQKREQRIASSDVLDDTTMREYGMSHRPSKTGGTAADITSKGNVIPGDFYQHPEWYADMTNEATKESWSALQKVKGKPDAIVTIYRASPKNELNDGDWITLSKKYAENESLDEGVKVHSFKVKAKDIQFAGDDINEFGYWPTNQ